MSHHQKVTTGQSQPGCMKVTMYIFPLISVYWAWIMPTAVGLYWVISSLTSFLQSFITNRYFSVNHMTAMAEARRTAALELAEMGILPEGMYRNRKFAECAVDGSSVALAVQDMLYDPQTAGGLLMAVDPADADALLAALQPVVPSAQRVGVVSAYQDGPRIKLI